MPGIAQLEVDAPATRLRLARLRRYVESNLLAHDDFVCPHAASCKASRRPGDAFREGVMSHVGARYDLVANGSPLRIVVAGQESGWPKDPGQRRFAQRVSLQSRHEQILTGSGLGRRYYAEPGFAGRNPHMRGTTSALRVLLGQGLGVDYDGEFVRPANGTPFHVFDGFALVNRLLCSAGPQNSSQGRPTRTMFSNCEDHFQATLAILEPTLVILQGTTVAKRATKALPVRRAYSAHLYEAGIGEGRTLVCSFSHPSAHGALRWGDSIDSPYLNRVVVPTLQQALRLT